MKTKALSLFVVAAVSVLSLNAQTVVYSVGDIMASTISKTDNPQRGWAQMLQLFFDPTEIKVDNQGRDGFSTKSYIDGGYWDKVINKVKEGDYLLIQFGHNDEKKQDPKRYTEAGGEYKENLTRFVNEAKAKGATPVLLTSPVRRVFNEETGAFRGHITQRYLLAVRDLAKELNVPLIDMDQISAREVAGMGPEDSKTWYMWVEAGTTQKWPDGVKDNSHFIGYGAFKLAEYVAQEFSTLGLPIAGKVKKDVKNPFTPRSF